MQRRVNFKNKFFTKAFSRVRAGGSLNPGVSYGEARARAKTLALVSSSLTGETKKEPCGVFGDGLISRSYLLEDVIHNLILKGDAVGLHNALKEYCGVWIELSKGGLCK